MQINSPIKAFFRNLLFLFFISGIIGCSGAKPPPSVTVEELRAHPETYNGQSIRVHGVKVSASEYSDLRPSGTKISAREEMDADSIWVGFDSDALEMNSSKESKRMSDAIRKAEETKAERLFFEFEADGVFRYAKRTEPPGAMHSVGFGQMNNYSSEFRITRLLSSKYLGGIRIEPLPETHRPLVWQEYLFTDLSHTQTVILSKKPEQKDPHHIELILEGEISGAAEIQVILAGKPFKRERLSGKLKISFHEDWFDPQVEIRYVTSEENSGTLKIAYTFVRPDPLPFKEVFVPPDDARN